MAVQLYHIIQFLKIIKTMVIFFFYHRYVYPPHSQEIVRGTIHRATNCQASIQTCFRRCQDISSA